jgi:hypothetical protein
MHDQDRINGLAADLPALGQHLAFRPHGQERQLHAKARETAVQVHAAPSAAAEAAGGVSSGGRKESASRESMLTTLDDHISSTAADISNLRAAGADATHLAMLDRHLAHMQELRDTIRTTDSPLVLAQLQQQMKHAIQGTSESVQAAQVAVASGHTASAAAAWHAASPETRRLLGQGSAEIATDADKMFGWGKKYGIDLHEEEEKERELRRKEEELRRKGDISGALGVHADRLRNEIGTADKIIGSEQAPAEKKAEAHGIKRKAEEELKKTLREQEQHNKGHRTGQAEQRAGEVHAWVEKDYRHDEKRFAAALERRSDRKKYDVHARADAEDESKSHSARKDEREWQVNNSEHANLGMQDGASSKKIAFGFDAAPEVKQQAKHAALPAAAAGATDSSKSADLSSEAKSAPKPQLADAGKASSGPALHA